MSAARQLKREAAMLALLAGKNHKQAAEAAGVDVRTLHRWRHEPEFAAELNRHRRIRFSRALNLYAAGGEVGIETLVSIARDPEQPAAARVGASRVLVAQFNDFRSSAPSAERLAYMEEPAGEGVEEDTE